MPEDTFYDPSPDVHGLPDLQGAAMSAAVEPLDTCSARRMMWFDKEDQRALFGDIRDDEHQRCDSRILKVEPDVLMDFRSQPLGTPLCAWSCSIRRI